MAKVIVDPHFRKMDEIFSPQDRARLDATVDVIWGKDEPMPEAEFRAALPDAEAVVVADWHHGDALYAADKLRAILTVSGGFPLSFDYAWCYDHRVRVLSASPAFAPQVAEWCLGAALSLCRGLGKADRDFRAGTEIWLRASQGESFLLFNQPVGFVGHGALARSLQPLLAPFNCAIKVYDPWLGDGYLRRQGVIPASLEETLADSRVIFVLAVPSSENRAMLSRNLLERIQPGAVLVLASRAHVIDFEAMSDLALAGRFKAAVDVFPNEPFDPNHRLRKAEGVLLSAHRAGSVCEGLWTIGEMVVDDLEAIAKGLPPLRLKLAEPEVWARYASSGVTPWKQNA